MNDFKIAYKWAVDTASAGKPIISDQFFSPFTARQARKLRKKLIKNCLYVWPLSAENDNGAIIIRKDAENAKFGHADGFVAGVYTSVDASGNEYCTLLGSLHFPDTIGKM